MTVAFNIESERMEAIKYRKDKGFTVKYRKSLNSAGGVLWV